jgi:hypothetical protein
MGAGRAPGRRVAASQPYGPGQEFIALLPWNSEEMRFLAYEIFQGDRIRRVGRGLHAQQHPRFRFLHTTLDIARMSDMLKATGAELSVRQNH